MAFPLATGYLAYKYTDGDLLWTAIGAIGGIYAAPLISMAIGYGLLGAGARY